MGLLKRDVILTVPSTGGMHLPDSKWCRKNLLDVDAMRYFARQSASKHRPLASDLATQVMGGWPFPEWPAITVKSALTDSFSLGLAYGDLSKGETMRREVWEALCVSAGKDTVREPEELVGAFVYACFAGNYVARRPGDTESVIRGLDWQEVLSVSPRVAVVQQAIEAVWAALNPPNP